MEKFNRDKVLKNMEHKKNRNTYIKYGTFVFAICIGVFSITYIAYSKFVTTSEIAVSSLTVGEFTQPTQKKAAYLDGSYIKGSSLVDGFPTKNDTYSVESVSCTNGVVGTFDTTTWELTVSDSTIATKCKIYFVTTSSSNTIENGTVAEEEETEGSSTDTTYESNDVTNTTESSTPEENTESSTLEESTESATGNVSE